MIVLRNPAVVSRRIGSQWVILESDKKHVRQLNQTAGFIWSKTARPISIDRLITLIGSHFHIPKKDIASDIKGFVRRYMKDGLLIEHTPSQST